MFLENQHYCKEAPALLSLAPKVSIACRCSFRYSPPSNNRCRQFGVPSLGSLGVPRKRWHDQQQQQQYGRLRRGRSTIHQPRFNGTTCNRRVSFICAFSVNEPCSFRDRQLLPCLTSTDTRVSVHDFPRYPGDVYRSNQGLPGRGGGAQVTRARSIGSTHNGINVATAAAKKNSSSSRVYSMPQNSR